MRRIVLLVGLSFATSVASAQGFARSYWLVADSQRHEWCGYTDPTAFQAAAGKINATQSAIVSYTLGKLTALTQQVGASNGAWIVIDRYTPARGGLQLQRTSMLSAQNLKVMQSASIRGGHAQPLHTVAVTTLQGQPASAPADLALPRVAIMTDLDSAPYMLLVTQMRHESIPTLCRRLQ
ncbi:MAG TPA: hypothetical protein VMF64_16905 [Steroidobacteraceae bacterium]|nr:hypothetical protein [Steroidobacteraceae bacterium]